MTLGRLLSSPPPFPPPRVHDFLWRPVGLETRARLAVVEGGKRRGRVVHGTVGPLRHGAMEVSLTILRNFGDSLARVDHVRPA